MRTAIICLAALSTLPAQNSSDLFTIYKNLHEHPEVSQHEERTPAFLARELRKAGFTVTEHVGKYTDGAAAAGIVAILSNGAGPTVLVRTDMDALPVEEKLDCPTPARMPAPCTPAGTTCT